MPRFLSFAALLAATPACVHTVPVRVAPDDSILIVSDVPVPIRAAAGEPVTVADDWSLVVATRDGKFTTLEAPLTLTHRDDALQVRSTDVELGRPIVHDYPDAHVQKLWLERPNVGGTIALIAVGTVVFAAGSWGLFQLFTIGER